MAKTVRLVHKLDPAKKQELTENLGIPGETCLGYETANAKAR